MLNNMRHQHLLYWLLNIAIALLIVWLCTKDSFLFKPFGTFISSVFVPVLCSGILYYLFNPIINLLMKIRVHHHQLLSRTTSVIILFLVLTGVLACIILFGIPDIVHQISDLVSNMPHLVQEASKSFGTMCKHGWMRKIPIKSYTRKLQSYATTYGKGYLSSSISDVISFITNTLINLITIPVMLFYMLNDGYKFKPCVAKLFPKKHRDHGLKLLGKMSDTISHYIDGQLIECLFVGTFTIIGYFLIGQSYAILLGAFGGLCVIIPYVGPYIGIAPAIMVALSSGIGQVIWVVIVVVIVEQIDGNLIYPNVVGKVLHIHPLTIIIILLAAGHIAGLFGMILAVPLYAVTKTVVVYLMDVHKIDQN